MAPESPQCIGNRGPTVSLAEAPHIVVSNFLSHDIYDAPPSSMTGGGGGNMRQVELSFYRFSGMGSQQFKLLYAYSSIVQNVQVEFTIAQVFPGMANKMQFRFQLGPGISGETVVGDFEVVDFPNNEWMHFAMRNTGANSITTMYFGEYGRSSLDNSSSGPGDTFVPLTYPTVSVAGSNPDPSFNIPKGFSLGSGIPFNISLLNQALFDNTPNQWLGGCCQLRVWTDAHASVVPLQTNRDIFIEDGDPDTQGLENNFRFNEDDISVVPFEVVDYGSRSGFFTDFNDFVDSERQFFAVDTHPFAAFELDIVVDLEEDDLAVADALEVELEFSVDLVDPAIVGIVDDFELFIELFVELFELVDRDDILDQAQLGMEFFPIDEFPGAPVDEPVAIETGFFIDLADVFPGDAIDLLEVVFGFGEFLQDEFPGQPTDEPITLVASEFNRDLADIFPGSPFDLADVSQGFFFDLVETTLLFIPPDVIEVELGLNVDLVDDGPSVVVDILTLVEVDFDRQFVEAPAVPADTLEEVAIYIREFTEAANIPLDVIEVSGSGEQSFIDVGPSPVVDSMELAVTYNFDLLETATPEEAVVISEGHVVDDLLDLLFLNEGNETLEVSVEFNVDFQDDPDPIPLVEVLDITATGAVNLVDVFPGDVIDEPIDVTFVPGAIGIQEEFQDEGPGEVGVVTPVEVAEFQFDIIQPFQEETTPLEAFEEEAVYLREFQELQTPLELLEDSVGVNVSLNDPTLFPFDVIASIGRGFLLQDEFPSGNPPVDSLALVFVGLNVFLQDDAIVLLDATASEFGINPTDNLDPVLDSIPYRSLFTLQDLVIPLELLSVNFFSPSQKPFNLIGRQATISTIARAR